LKKSSSILVFSLLTYVGCVSNESVQKSAVSTQAMVLNARMGTPQMLMAPPRPEPVPSIISMASPRPEPVPPMANFSNETYDSVEESDFKSVTTDPLSTFSVDVDTASYSNIRRFLESNRFPSKDAVRIEEMINYFDYGYKNRDQTIKIFSEVGTPIWNRENRLVKIALKGREIDKKALSGSNLVFLVDISGSMRDDLEIVKSSLKLLLENLSEKDFVSIVTYAGSTGVLLKSTRVSKKNRDEILEKIEKLSFGGSTGGEAGINLAYGEAEKSLIPSGNNRIILVTDGDFNVGLSSPNQMDELISKKRDSGIFLTVAGIGMGNYRDNMVETLADKGNGNYFYIDSLLEAKKVFSRDIISNLYSIAKDTKIQVEFNPKYVSEYRLIGYENRKLENRDFTDDKKDAGEVGVGDEVTALYEIKLSDGKVDSGLKYQSSQLTEKANNGELLTVKVRYKELDSNSSTEIEHIVKVGEERVSEDFNFVMSVASFGMKLRKSKFTESVNYSDIISLARESKGSDFYGYRAEFIKLVEMAQILDK
jgi:Ca-activated chloride channel family protein